MNEVKESPMFQFGRNNGVKTINILDADGSKLVFNYRMVGPRDVAVLRGIEYGPEGAGFSQATFGEIFLLANVTEQVYKIETRNVGNNKPAQLMKRLRSRRGIVGKTTVFGAKDGILVADENPPENWFRDVSKYERSLRDRLTSKEDGGVVFSHDNLVRLAAYGSNPDSLLTSLLGSWERTERYKTSVPHWASSVSNSGRGFNWIHSPVLRLGSIGYLGSEMFHVEQAIEGDRNYSHSMGILRS